MVDLSGMPACGISCLVSALSYASCATTNLTCLCTDVAYQAGVSKCILANCTITEGLTVEKISRAGCGIPETNDSTYIIAQVLVHFALETVFFGMRILCRVVRIAPWGMDDTTIVIAYILVSTLVGIAIFEIKIGFGKNIWVLTPTQITTFLQVYFTFEILYTAILAMTKISICFLYLRLFPDKKFRRLVWATQVFNVCVLVTFTFSSTFQCRPLSYFWTGWDGEHSGACDNINAAAWAHAGTNIALDFWMLGLPASQVWKLNMPTRKRFNIIAMFGFGILLTVFSIIRLKSLTTFQRTSNPTKDLISVSIWSSLEITVGFIVACMPAARLLVVRYIPRVKSCFSRGSSIRHNKAESIGIFTTPATIGSGGGGGGTGSRAWKFQKLRKSGRARRDIFASELDEDLAAGTSAVDLDHKSFPLEPPRAHIAARTSYEELLPPAALCTMPGCAPEDEHELPGQTAARESNTDSAGVPP